jgi:hypothetical protein
MSSWNEPAHYNSHLSVHYPQPMDYPENSLRGADPPSIYTGYSYNSRPSPNSGRPPYNSGLYGPRPLPTPAVEPIQGLPTSTMMQPEMEDIEEDNDEYMDVEPGVDADGGPLYQSEYYDEATQPVGKRRFVGGFIRRLRKIPKVVRRGFLSEKREVMSPPGISYRQPSYRAPYMYDTRPDPEEPEEAPPYDAPSEPMDGDSRYTDTINMPSEFQSPAGPSRTLSQAIRGPRSESQLTYQSLTNPPARHISQHGSLHQSQRSSPPRTVRNPDPPSPTDESGTAHPNSPRPSQPPPELEPESASRTPHLSPLEPARRPTVTVQSPNGSPVYFEQRRSDDYANMDMDSPVEYTAEPSAPSQISRVARFFRDLNNLPWVAPNITADFDPTDAERGRNAHLRGPGKSWYTGHLHDLDLLEGGGGGSSTRRLTAPSGNSFGRAPGSSATLAPQHGSGSASSSEGAVSAHHLPTAPAPQGYPYTVPTLALPPQPLYLYPYPALQPPPLQPQPQPQKSPQPSPPHAPDGTTEQTQVSPQLSGSLSQSGVPGQPYYFVVAMPPGGYVPGPVDPSRPPMQMQPAFAGSFTSPV